MKISARVMQVHIEDLCDHYDIGWSTFPSGRGFCGLALPELWEIETPAIQGRISYATALHEIGHLVGPFNHPRYLTLVKEEGALAMGAPQRPDLVTRHAEARGRVACVVSNDDRIRHHECRVGGS
jgi:hypothetical protein